MQCCAQVQGVLVNVELGMVVRKTGTTAFVAYANESHDSRIYLQKVSEVL